MTGASSGIGKVAASMLANAGYTVFGLARNYGKLAELATKLPPDRYFPIAFDVTQPETFENVVSTIAAKSQIFGLVNSAGFVEPGAIEDLSMSSLRSQFETNFFGLVGLTKVVLSHMMNRGDGRIVNVSSMAGLVNLPLIGAYCATKHALEAVTDALRMELWDTGIKVVSINPGVINTNIHNITMDRIAIHSDSRFASAYSKYLQDTPKGLAATAVGEAIVHAMTSDKPKLRYLIGSAREKAGIRFRPLIPDSLFYSQVSHRILS